MSARRHAARAVGPAGRQIPARRVPTPHVHRTRKVALVAALAAALLSVVTVPAPDPSAAAAAPPGATAHGTPPGPDPSTVVLAPGLAIEEAAPPGMTATAGVVPTTDLDGAVTTATVTGPAATFQVTYQGFGANPAAQAAFQAAVDTWAGQISSSVPIVVAARLGSTTCAGQTFTGNVLGSAGPQTFSADWTTPGTSPPPLASTFYPGALANAIAGIDLDPAHEDVCASFNSAFTNLYFGTDGNVPPGQVDFESVVLHELGHGLGLIGSMATATNPTQATCCFNGSKPVIYDRFTTLDDGTSLVSLPRPSAALLTALSSGDVFFRGPATTALAGPAGARLYAPTTFTAGSSYSHLDEDTYPEASGDALMSPELFTGEVEHAPGPVAMAAMADLGWKTVTPPPLPTGGLYHPVDPTRVLDTRNGTGRNGLIGKVGPAGTVRLGFDTAVVPTTATAVVISLVATNGTANSLLTVWPDDGSTTPPTLSNVNFGANQTINNLVSAKLDPVTHRIAVANLAGSTDIVADLLGYYDGGTDPTGQHYVAIDPTRVVDTRTGTGTGGVIAKLGAGGILRAGFTGAPASIPTSATAVVVSVVSTDSTAGSFLTLFPDNGTTTIPNASNVNFPPGATVNNLAMVKLDPTTHRLAIGNQRGATDVVADLVGYFVPATTGSSYTALTPTRVLDTRTGLGRGGVVGKVGPTSIRLGMAAVPLTATAVVISLVATNGTANSFLTVWPNDGTATPNASMVNFGTGSTVNNLVSAKVDPVHRQIRIQNLAGTTDLVADLLGYYAP